MKLDVHPEAARRAEELVAHALDGMDSAPAPHPNRDSPYVPDLPVSGTIGPTDIAWPIIGSQTDRFGREIEKWYADDSRHFVLRGPAHAQFRNAVQVLHRQRDVTGVASEDTVARLVFEWMWRRRIDGPTIDLTHFVLAQLARLISDVEVVIPLFGVHVQSPLEIGRVSISDITEDELSSWRSMSHRSGPGRIESADAMHDKLRKQLQGRGAARMRLIAEQDFAVRQATEQSELSVAILRLASIGAFAPEIPTPFALMGHERVPKGMHVVLGPNDAVLGSEFIVNPEEQRPWILDDDLVRRVVRPIVDHWSALLTKDHRTPLEEAALRSALLYSRATRHRNISEKLLHVFAAIESLLLRAESEPISAVVGDRLAFAVGRNADERKKIVRTFRDVYAVRSRFVHHALETAPDSNTLRLLESFLTIVSQFFVNLRLAMSLFDTKEAFIDALEARKYA